MSELNILQQNIDKPNTVTEEDIVVTRDNQTFTIKGRFNGEEGVFTYDADVQPNDQLQFLLDPQPLIHVQSIQLTRM